MPYRKNYYVRKASASKIQRAFKNRTKRFKFTRKGLTKVEKKETKAIVKSAIKKEHVLKYFNSANTDIPVAPQVSTVSNKNQVSVIAFSSTTEYNASGAAVKYGPQDYVPLLLARPFKESNTNPALEAQAMNGQYILPKRATTTFSIERVAYNVAHAQGGTTNPTPNMARSLPIGYRIIKVGIKAAQGTQNSIDPNTDLFINSFGQPTGIDSNDFDRLDIRMSPINTKKYTKLMDTQGVINQNNIITPSDFAGQLTDIVTQKNGSHDKVMTIPFMLSQRKNQKLFYEDPQAPGTTSATSNIQRQLVLCHFFYINGHNLVGAEGQPAAPDLNDLQIKYKSTSAFVDAQ